MAVMPILLSQTADSQERVAVRQVANTYGGPAAVRKMQNSMRMCVCNGAL